MINDHSCHTDGISILDDVIVVTYNGPSHSRTSFERSSFKPQSITTKQQQTWKSFHRTKAPIMHQTNAHKG